MKPHLVKFTIVAIAFFYSNQGIGQTPSSNHGVHGKKLEQLGQKLRSPNRYRNADGSPGSNYWQQRVDYEIECELDTEKRRLNGQEKITYYNQSPNNLYYLWLQLDEKQHAPDAEYLRSYSSGIVPEMGWFGMGVLDLVTPEGKNHGDKIEEVIDENGKALSYHVNKTMMRVVLPKALEPGEQFVFHIKWHYDIIDRKSIMIKPRGGYEHFPDNDNYIYTMTQWYPRLCVYSDFEGWQNKQYTGQGEFGLTFGNFEVKMKVPDNHIVAATGECLNYEEVLTDIQLDRWNKAKESKTPVEIVTLSDAKQNEKNKKVNGTKTWIYKAENVRDFAWGSSEKFVWDAMPHHNANGKKVMCMSFYGKEAYPLYSKYGTSTIVKTLENYSKYTFPYPYPSAIAVEADNGMEYPMICFSEGRADKEGKFTEKNKYTMITTVIHEVGHNYFPMIVNSDERQWGWMDEGINSFLEYLTELEIDSNFMVSTRSLPGNIKYKRAPKPIMTSSDDLSFYNYYLVAYTKPAAALNVLRETIIGHESFDFAFKNYAKRWAFKHPTPTDFFRAMEDASGIDLDWFWKGWFYGTDHVDISLDNVKWYKFNSGKKVMTEKAITNTEQDSLSKENYYELSFSNKGGLIMPIKIQWIFKDGSEAIDIIPVTIWRLNEDKFTKVYIKSKEIAKVNIDPYNETLDLDLTNNKWPRKNDPLPSRFEVFKRKK